MADEVVVRLSVKDRAQFSREMGTAARDTGAIGAAAQASNTKWQLFGQKMQSVGRQLDTVGKRILTGIGRSIKIVSLGAAALFGGALFGGAKRLIGLEDAEKRMTSMGLSAQEVKRQSEGLLRVLLGTPYALNEGASSMAKLIASGRDLNKIEDTMRLLTDSAAFAQVPLDEVADLFTKVQTRGRLTGMELMQMETRGVPALRMLADAAGVSGEEMREMISKGEISADRFFRLYEKGAQGFGKQNIKIAGAALEMGDTTRGAFANMMTAASRFGATLLGPIFGSAKDVFGSISGWLDDMGAKLGPVAERIGEALPGAFEAVKDQVLPVLERIGDIISDHVVPAVEDAVEWFNRNRETIIRVAQVLVPAIAILGSLAVAIHLVKAAWMAFQAATPLGLILLLISALVFAYQESETFRAIVNAVFKAVFRVIKFVIGGAIDTISGLVDFFGTAWDLIRRHAKTGMRILLAVITGGMSEVVMFVIRNWAKVKTISRTIWNWVADKVEWVIEKIQKLIDRVKDAINWVKDLVDKAPSPGKMRTHGFSVPGFAGGGRVAANRPIIVGEKRPEVWVPDTPGMIIPSVEDFRATMDPRRAGGTGGRRDLVVPVTIDGREIGRAVLEDIDEQLAGR